jgi:hypothetical protein
MIASIQTTVNEYDARGIKRGARQDCIGGESGDEGKGVVTGSVSVSAVSPEEIKAMAEE